MLSAFDCMIEVLTARLKVTNDCRFDIGQHRQPDIAQMQMDWKLGKREEDLETQSIWISQVEALHQGCVCHLQHGSNRNHAHIMTCFDVKPNEFKSVL